ncbi:MAG: tetratricopeptide repeat protein [Deltaproteobacteria bacterium]|nr:tetratricopeptide repeat protein [Deltaproteobacteria bacterium]
MHRTNLNVRLDAMGKRGFAIGLVALLLATGCITTSEFADESPGVSVARAKRDLGIEDLKTNRTGMAIRGFRASLELDADDPQTHLWLGEAYRRKSRTPLAEEHLVEAIRLAARSKDIQTEQEARLNLSALLSQMGRYEDSIEHCERLAADPTLSTPWRPMTNCGWALMRLGRLDEAREHFVEALDFFPRFGPALLNLGILEAKQGNRLAAIKTLELIDEARIGRSGKAEANYRLGELYVALGRRDLALTRFLAAVEAAPTLDWGSQSQAYLDLLR